jgi:hypothetical protein
VPTALTNLPRLALSTRATDRGILLKYQPSFMKGLVTCHPLRKIHEPFSTCIPPASSVGFISFQNTIRSCPSLTVRVTSTSPSFSNSSTAAGASFHDSLSARTDIPLPFRVCLCISTRSAALFRKLYSCLTHRFVTVPIMKSS